MGVLTRAVRNISRRKTRALLVVVALGFSMAIMVSIPAGVTANQLSTQSLTSNLSGLITQTETSLNQTLTEVDCSLSLRFQGFGFSGGQFSAGGFAGGSQAGGFMPPSEFGGGPFGGGGEAAMNASLYTDVNASLPDVAAVVPVLQVSIGHNVTIERFGRNFTRVVADYVIEGVPLVSPLVDDYPILPVNITAGRNLQAGDSGVVLLSENNTGYFGVGVGDNVTILGQTFTVVGVHGASGVSDRLTLYMNLSDAQALTNNTGQITLLKVFADNSADVSSVANEISALHPELTVVTNQQRLSQLQAMQASYGSALQNAESTVSQMQATATQEIVVAVAATSLIIFFLMLYTVRERTREIGTLKAIGFSGWNIMSQFMLEGVLLSLLGGVVGIIIGYATAPMLASLLLPHVNPFNSAAGFRNAAASSLSIQVLVTPTLVLAALAAAAALGALGTLYPAWRASRTRPAEAMRYE
jgi:ABC-type antimicrobial peptide transport system permease subunit